MPDQPRPRPDPEPPGSQRKPPNADTPQPAPAPPSLPEPPAPSSPPEASWARGHSPALEPAAPGAPRRGREWTEEQVEQWIGLLLLAGVMLAAVAAAIGGAVYLARYGGDHESYRVFHGVPRGLDTVHGVVAGALHLRSRWVIQLGLLLLIATPVARVALSLFAFAHQRDRLYVLVTAIVLALLLSGLIGPGVG